MQSTNPEEIIRQLIDSGELEIDNDGRVWRNFVKYWNRWKREFVIRPCPKRRAENGAKDGYYQIRSVVNRKRVHCMAHRLVWLYFNEPIPEGITINHKNGKKTDNDPQNLELATLSQQAVHARTVLGLCKQNGENNNNSRLSDAQVDAIRVRRSNGERVHGLASEFGVSKQYLYDIFRGRRRAKKEVTACP